MDKLAQGQNEEEQPPEFLNFNGVVFQREPLPKEDEQRVGSVRSALCWWLFGMLVGFLAAGAVALASFLFLSGRLQ